MTKNSQSKSASEPPVGMPPAWTPIAEALKDLKFGEVKVIVQDGRIVQIDRLEKRRLSADATLPTV